MVPQAFWLNTLKRLSQPTWRGGNGVEPQGRHNHAVFPGKTACLTNGALPMAIWDTPLPPSEYLGPEARKGFFFLQDQTT
jgi:hypothetical protein